MSELRTYTPDGTLKAPEGIGVYAIRCAVTGGVYVGSVARVGGFRDRWREHVRGLDGGRSKCVKLRRAWAKYGRDAFTFEILEELDRLGDDEATIAAVLAAEQRHIAALDAVAKGFNVRTVPNSNLGVKLTDEQRQARRERVAADPAWQERLRAKGRKHSEETKAKMGEIARARGADPAYRQRLSEAIAAAHKAAGGMSEERKAKIGAKAAGRTASEETRRKMSESHKGSWSEERKAAMSERVKARWLDPEFKAKAVQERKGRRHSPETLEKMRAAQQARFADPVERARMIEAQQAGFRAAKAKANGGP